MGLNHVVLVGRLVADPDIKATSSGLAIAVFTIAVNDFYKNEKKSYFFDMKAFGKTAELLRDYYKKGRLIGIEGKLTQEHWETKEGEKRSKIVVMVQNLDLQVGAPKKEEVQEDLDKQNTNTKSNNLEERYIESDLPF